MCTLKKYKSGQNCLTEKLNKLKRMRKRDTEKCVYLYCLRGILHAQSYYHTEGSLHRI